MLDFRGGIRPDAHKYAENISLEDAPVPSSVRLPLYCCSSTVKVGDKVSIGQPLTDDNRAHAPVSGTVTEKTCRHIKIENDGEARIYAEAAPFAKSFADASPNEILSCIAGMGIYFGGEKFLYDRLMCAAGKTDALIVSVVETEPFTCSRQRIFAERKEEIIYGAKILMKALGAVEIFIIIEGCHSHDRTEALHLTADEGSIKVITSTSKYPAGNPRVLTAALARSRYGRGRLKTDRIFFTYCEECEAVFSCLKTGLPMIKRIVTVDGNAIPSPKNLMCTIGTPISVLLDYCGISREEAGDIILGTTVNGARTYSDCCIAKENPVLLAFKAGFLSPEEQFDCIKCGKCHLVCPMGLYPMPGFNKVDPSVCLFCRCCSYVCPSKIELPLINTEVQCCND